MAKRKIPAAPATKSANAFEIMDISVDIDARNTGTWVENNKAAPGLVFCAIGYDSPTIEALEIALSKERPDQYGQDDGEKITLERNRFENRRKCEAGIIGWRTFTMRGEPVEYSEAKKKELFHDPRFQNFLLAAMNAMNQADKVKIKWDKAAEKNSEAGSDESSESGDGPEA